MKGGSVQQDQSEWNVVFIPRELDDYPLSMSEFRAYSRIARRAGDKGRYWEGVDKASAAMMMHADTLRNALEALVAFRMIAVKAVPGKPNEYSLVPASKWFEASKAIAWREAREATRSAKRAAKSKRDPSTNSPPHQNHPPETDTPPSIHPPTPPSIHLGHPPGIDGDEGTPLKVLPQGSTTTTDNSEIETPTDSSQLEVAAADQIPVQTPSPTSDASGTDQKLEGGAGRDGNSRTGLEDSPGAALEAASDALRAYLGGTRCRTKYPTDHAAYSENHLFWLENRAPDFILECVRLSRNGVGVDKNPFGALIKWLETPATAPDNARDLQLRLERGLSPALERLTMRQYRNGDGVVQTVERWAKNGDAILGFGVTLPRAATRLWELLPSDYAPAATTTPTPQPSSEPRASKAQVSAALERLRIKPKTIGGNL